MHYLYSSRQPAKHNHCRYTEPRPLEAGLLSFPEKKQKNPAGAVGGVVNRSGLSKVSGEARFPVVNRSAVVHREPPKADRAYPLTGTFHGPPPFAGLEPS